MPLYRNGAKIVFFVHIPKTGGSSIEKAFRRLGCKEAFRFNSKRPFSKCTLQHMHKGVYKEAIRSGFADYSFAVKRNPYDRMASEFRMKALDRNERQNPDKWILEALERFKEFSFTRDNHIRPQVEFISETTEVFAFEDGLEAAMAPALKVLGLNPPKSMPHEKKGSREKIRVKNKTVEALAQFYARDFDELGYDTGDFGKHFEIDAGRWW
ncbi:MAG TPA: hypothetical protein ENJ90_03110 [Devosia sp.]|nr:hypothetical protein [Devosia sp.]